MATYFKLQELIESPVATKLYIKNIPNFKEVSNLNNLVDKILDPLRDWYGKPIKVNSGYRCKELNEAIGGAEKSQHLLGEAADITAGSVEENKKLFTFIKNNTTFDQLIWEKGGAWVHVSCRAGATYNKKQVLKID